MSELELNALVLLHMPYDFYEPRRVGKQAIFDGRIDFNTRPHIGEKIRAHDFFTNDYGGGPIIGKVTSIEHGLIFFQGDELEPGIYVEAEFFTDEDYNEAEIIEMHEGLKSNGWRLGSMT